MIEHGFLVDPERVEIKARGHDLPRSRPQIVLTDLGISRQFTTPAAKEAVRVGDAPAVRFTTRLLRRPAEPVHGTMFVLVSAAPRAAVLLIGGSGGSEPSYVAEPLARAGVAALSLAYFARPGLPGQLRDISLEYFFSALEVLRDHLPPDTPLAVLGMSGGSEAAMLTAIWSGARVHGVLATVPGNVVAGSWPPGGSAWLLDGRPCRTRITLI
jgi:pimeloyl-ACP methyl ester carboxylesterase